MYFMVATPMTSPRSLMTGPPLLPGLMAASVWMNRTPSTSRMALTMPRVTVSVNVPSGEPITMTGCPTLMVVTLPSRAAGWGVAGATVESSARSTLVSTFATRAASVVPSASFTVTMPAPVTTCALVRRLVAEMKKPLPLPRDVLTTATAGIRSAMTSSTGRVAAVGGAIGGGADKGAAAVTGGYGSGRATAAAPGAAGSGAGAATGAGVSTGAGGWRRRTARERSGGDRQIGDGHGRHRPARPGAPTGVARRGLEVLGVRGDRRRFERAAVPAAALIDMPGHTPAALGAGPRGGPGGVGHHGLGVAAAPAGGQGRTDP